MSDINIAELLRSGNIVRDKPVPMFAEWIMRSVNGSLESGYDVEPYWHSLEEMRPDIANVLIQTEFDPFWADKGEWSLTDFVAKVYRLW